MNVAQVMTRLVFTCRPGDTLETAAATMAHQKVGCLPVVNGDGFVIGMLTDRDICLAAYKHRLALSQIDVASAMSTEIQACAPSHDLAVAEALMRRRRVRRAPVINDDRGLVGIVSLEDLSPPWRCAS